MGGEGLVGSIKRFFFFFFSALEIIWEKEGMGDGGEESRGGEISIDLRGVFGIGV